MTIHQNKKQIVLNKIPSNMTLYQTYSYFLSFCSKLDDNSSELEPYWPKYTPPNTVSDANLLNVAYSKLTQPNPWKVKPIKSLEMRPTLT